MMKKIVLTVALLLGASLFGAAEQQINRVYHKRGEPVTSEHVYNALDRILETSRDWYDQNLKKTSPGISEILDKVTMARDQAQAGQLQAAQATVQEAIDDPKSANEFMTRNFGSIKFRNILESAKYGSRPL